MRLSEKPEISKKHSPSLTVLNSVLGKLVLVQFENFPVYLHWKKGASDHSEVLAFGLDLKKNLGFPFSNLDTQENIQITLGQFFQTLR